MRAMQKLVKNGNSTAVSIPRVMLVKLGWLPGESIILEETETGEVLLRRPTDRDVAPVGAPRILQEPHAVGGR